MQNGTGGEIEQRWKNRWSKDQEDRETLKAVLGRKSTRTEIIDNLAGLS